MPPPPPFTTIHTLPQKRLRLRAVDPIRVPAPAAKEEPDGPLPLLGRIGLQGALVRLFFLAHLEAAAPVADVRLKGACVGVLSR